VVFSSLFSRGRQRDVQSFILNLINNHCPGLQLKGEELREESRINLTVVVLVVPVKDGRAQVDQCLVTVSKEFSNTGLSIVLSELLPLDDVILGFRREGSTTFIRAKAKHVSPMGAGFFQLGLKLLEVVPAGEYPELETLADRF
jgi:hypothetical protein